MEKHKDIIPDILGLHAISGCDTVAATYGVGKLTALKVLWSGKYTLNHLGDRDAYLENVIDQATKFVLACYGQSTSSSLTVARQKLWAQKVGRNKAAAPRLCSLPPTTESFKHNVLRAHLKMTIWTQALDVNPPDLEPTSYGWSKDKCSTSLVPVTVPEGVALAPN